MVLLATTFAYCVLSGLIPVVNAEAYVGGVALVVDDAGVWAVGAAAAAGQMLAKVAYYYLGKSSLNWKWVRRHTEKPKWKERFDRWQQRVDGNRWAAGVLLAVSASVGIPPFAVVAVLAGYLRIPVVMFIIIGFLGRFARFAAVLGLVQTVIWF